MTTILSATSRGQITLPKNWRERFDTRFYEAVIEGDQIHIKPLVPHKNLENSIEDAWQEYKEGKVVSQATVIRKYGL